MVNTTARIELLIVNVLQSHTPLVMKLLTADHQIVLQEQNMLTASIRFTVLSPPTPAGTAVLIAAKTRLTATRSERCVPWMTIV